MALKGVRVLELAGLAPAPFCGMILADFGASVIRIDKLPPSYDIDCLGNGKKSILLNLKSQDGIQIFKKLANSADVLIEPFRPGVMEKLGLSPENLLKENKKLIYARLSGFGQTGPYSQRAGHDINFIAISGLLSMIGGPQKIPSPPANFAGDFAGGGLICALGIVMALFERSKSGIGQIVDASMTSGSAYAGSWLYRSKTLPMWTGPRGTNLVDGGSHYYRCYETQDGKFMAVAAIEPQFYETFMKCLGLDPDEISPFPDDTTQVIKQIGTIFKQHPQSHWIKVFHDKDACVTPVLEVEEASQINGLLTKCNNGTWAPIPAPGLSRTPGRTLATEPRIEQGQHTLEILKEAGYSKEQIEQFIVNNVVSSSKL